MSDKLLFNEQVGTLITAAQLREIIQQVNQYPEKYGDRSHFIRVAILKELRSNKRGR